MEISEDARESLELARTHSVDPQTRSQWLSRPCRQAAPYKSRTAHSLRGPIMNFISDLIELRRRRSRGGAATAAGERWRRDGGRLFPSGRRRMNAAAVPRRRRAVFESGSSRSHDEPREPR